MALTEAGDPPVRPGIGSPPPRLARREQERGFVRERLRPRRARSPRPKRGATRHGVVTAGWFEALPRAPRRSLRLLVVAADPPDAPWKLRGPGPFGERAFVRLRIGRLTQSAAREALAAPRLPRVVPWRRTSPVCSWTPRRVPPDFLQIRGSAAWDAAERLGPRGALSAAAARSGSRRRAPSSKTSRGPAGRGPRAARTSSRGRGPGS